MFNSPQDITDVEPRDPTEVEELDYTQLSHEQLCQLVGSLLKATKEITSQLLILGQQVATLREQQQKL